MLLEAVTSVWETSGAPGAAPGWFLRARGGHWAPRSAQAPEVEAEPTTGGETEAAAGAPAEPATEAGEAASTSPPAANAAASPAPASADGASPVPASGATVTQAPATPATAEDCPNLCKPLARPLSDTLPNVLVVGDHIASGYFHVVQGLLQQVASVQRASLFDVSNEDNLPEGVCSTTVGALACIDAWLGADTVWHVVVFNWGLRDVSPSMDMDEYVARIKQIYVKIFSHIASAGAAVWLTTTPTPPGCLDKPNAVVQEMNDAVQAMWDAASKPPDVEDMNKIFEHACHANTTTRCYPDDCSCDQLQYPTNGTFNAFGNQFLGMHIADLIRSYL